MYEEIKPFLWSPGVEIATKKRVAMMTSYPGVHQFTFFAFCSLYTRACICELGLNSCLCYIHVKFMRQESVQEFRSDFSTADGRSAAI